MVTCKSRQDYRSSMIDGRVCVEVEPNGKSAAEIAELWAYIATRLAKKDGRRGKAG